MSYQSKAFIHGWNLYTEEPTIIATGKCIPCMKSQRNVITSCGDRTQCSMGRLFFQHGFPNTGKNEQP